MPHVKGAPAWNKGLGKGWKDQRHDHERLRAINTELLEALEECEQVWRRGNARYSDFERTANRARAAIQKARA